MNFYIYLLESLPMFVIDAPSAQLSLFLFRKLCPRYIIILSAVISLVISERKRYYASIHKGKVYIMICSQHTDLAKNTSENSGQKQFNSSSFSSSPIQMHAVVSIVDECRGMLVTLGLALALGR